MYAPARPATCSGMRARLPSSLRTTDQNRHHQLLPHRHRPQNRPSCRLLNLLLVPRTGRGPAKNPRFQRRHQHQHQRRFRLLHRLRLRQCPKSAPLCTGSARARTLSIPRTACPALGTRSRSARSTWDSAILLLCGATLRGVLARGL